MMLSDSEMTIICCKGLVYFNNGGWCMVVEWVVVKDISLTCEMYGWYKCDNSM
jgi:hypothetical protein